MVGTGFKIHTCKTYQHLEGSHPHAAERRKAGMDQATKKVQQKLGVFSAVVLVPMEFGMKGSHLPQFRIGR